MGMGRLEMEMDFAEEVTERRRVMEIEKEDTEELRQKYKDYAEKEKAIAKALEDLKANFYCELCEKQYYKHKEFDNHINSYDHAHKQRLKELKQREFARNVSSRSHKDERKQEKALRRLHELADLRKQTERSPGSMFKMLSEGESEDMFFGADELADKMGLYPESATDTWEKGSESPHSSSNSQGATAIQPFIPKGDGDSPATATQKLGVSFSFSKKKVPSKLESSASVFSESNEEVVESKEVTLSYKGKLTSLPEGVVPALTEAEAKAKAEEDEKAAAAAAAEASRQRRRPKEPEMATVMEYYYYTPPAHCKVKPKFPFMIFCKSAERVLDHDLDPADKNKTEEGDENKTTAGQDAAEVEEKQQQQQSDDVQVSESPAEDKDVCLPESEHPEEQSVSSEVTAAAPTTTIENNVKTEMGVKDEACCSTAAAAATESPEVDAVKVEKPRKAAEPFFSVLSRDEATTLQWPSELLLHTKTEPSISYSCNPLYFEFKPRLRQLKEKVNPTAPADSCEQPGEQASPMQTEAETDHEHKFAEGTAVESATDEVAQESCPSAAVLSLETGGEPLMAKGGEAITTAEAEGPTLPEASKVAKKHKKHKKSGKHSKHKSSKQKGSKPGKPSSAYKEQQGAMAAVVGATPELQQRSLKSKHKKKKTTEGKPDKAAVKEESARPESSAQADEKEVTQKRHKHKEAGQAQTNADDKGKKAEPTPQCSSAKTSSKEKGSSGGLEVKMPDDTGTKKSSHSKSKKKSRHSSKVSESDKDAREGRTKKRSPSPRRSGPHDSDSERSRSGRRSASRRRYSSYGSDSSSSRGRSYSSKRSSEREGSHRRHRRRRRHSSKRSYDAHDDYSGSQRRAKRRRYSSSSDASYRRRSRSRSGRSYSRRRSGSRDRRRHSRGSTSRSRSRRSSARRSRSGEGGRRGRRGGKCRDRSFERSARRRGGDDDSSSTSRERSFRSRSDSRAAPPAAAGRPGTSRRECNRRNDDNKKPDPPQQAPPPQRCAQAQKESVDTAEQRREITQEERNLATAKRLLERIRSKRQELNSLDGDGAFATTTKVGIRLKDPPQGFFGPKLPPTMGNVAVLPMIGKLPICKRPCFKKDGDMDICTIFSDPEKPTLESFLPFSLTTLDVETQPLLSDASPTVTELTQSNDTCAASKPEESPSDNATVQDTCTNMDLEPIEPTPLPDCQPPPQLHLQLQPHPQIPPRPQPQHQPQPQLPEPQPQPYSQYHPWPQSSPIIFEEPKSPTESMASSESCESERSHDRRRAMSPPLSAQPISFAPEEMEKYWQLQQQAQQHIQQQLMASKAKSMPPVPVMSPQVPSPTPIIQHVAVQPQPPQQQHHPAVSISTVHHTLLQHHAAAVAAGLHPLAAHHHHHHAHHHPGQMQMAQVHALPQHHLAHFSLAPFPAHHAFQTGTGGLVHVIPASALHPTLALHPMSMHHHHATAFVPAMLAPHHHAFQLHPLIHPAAFAAQDVHHHHQPPSS